MDKYKIYSLDSSFNLIQMKEKLSNHHKSPDINFEFIPLKFTDSFISYNFSEKKILETTFLDKNGDEQTIEYLHIDSFEFRIINSNDNLYIILINPYRSLKLFKNYLVDILDYKIGFSEIVLNPLDWLIKVENISKCNFHVLSMEIKDIIFDSNTSGAMTLKSLNDIRKSYTDIVKNKNFKINKVLITNDDYYKGKLILSKDASFQIDTLNSTRLINFLIESI